MQSLSCKLLIFCILLLNIVFASKNFEAKSKCKYFIKPIQFIFDNYTRAYKSYISMDLFIKANDNSPAYPGDWDIYAGFYVQIKKRNPIVDSAEGSIINVIRNKEALLGFHLEVPQKTYLQIHARSKYSCRPFTGEIFLDNFVFEERDLDKSEGYRTVESASILYDITNNSTLEIGHFTESPKNRYNIHIKFEVLRQCPIE